MDSRLFICFIFLASLRIFRGQTLRCDHGKWQCDDGSCIPDVWRCDGDGDCLDGSDEVDCAGSTVCPAGQFPCKDSVGCVDALARCDGQKQCPTGSDEENCPPIEGCLNSDWKCQNRICIPKEFFCNGVNDCGDNSDENDCGLCSEDGVRCPDGTCVSAGERCDGKFHCYDGSDEPITCGRLCSMNNGGCSYACTDEPWGTLCSCPVGYKLSPNGAHCEDLDECASPLAPCAHYCINTVGSYYCRCEQGFKFGEPSTCLALDDTLRLLLVEDTAIGLLNVESQALEAFVHSVFDPVAFAFDVAREWYYWADSRGNIYKSDDRRSWIAYTGEPGIRGLACDWLNGNLFWTNEKTESIYMQATDGKSYTTVLSKNIRPSELVIIPLESLMIWINAGHGDRVTLEKSWMDGSERSSLAVLTAQSAHSLTADVAARRLYWISDFKRSIETVKVDGTGRYSFMGLFNERKALSLAVFENSFYWFDDEGLWQAAQNQPSQRKFIWNTDLPLLAVYHRLQQPQGYSACKKTPCPLCQLTKSNLVGFTCSCPNFKVLLLDGTCENPRFLYATNANINLLEFRGEESIETQLFTTNEGILSFDMDWDRDWLYWTNRTGYIQRTSLTQLKTEVVRTPLPVCFINVDQRSGSIYWVSRNQNAIGTIKADSHNPKQLYYTTKEIQNLYLDWLRGEIIWLEEDRILTMSMLGGDAKQLLHLAGGIKRDIAFDLRANSLLWISKKDLRTMSLLRERSHQAGRRWNISGSVVAALEPFLLSISDDVMTLWDQRDGRPIQDVTVRGQVLGVIVALMDIQPGQICREPSLFCRHSSVCLPQDQLCDGKKDCPYGDDEEFCAGTCLSKEDFKCQDHSSCISRNLVCDGQPDCRDGSDEFDCPTVASPTSRANILLCRRGSKPCKDGKDCVLYSHLCDGEVDCEDGSDELGCDAQQQNRTTKASETPHSTSPPPQTLPVCISPSVLCPSSFYLCISPNQFCNGHDDCPDGFDEKDCVKSCPSKSDFPCKDRRSCIPKSLVCDGHAHCYDGSDEVNCPSVAQPAPKKNTKKCLLGFKLCQDGNQCILYSHVCNGERDCLDGSDEEGCSVAESAMQAEKPSLNESPVPFTQPRNSSACTRPSVLCPGSALCIKPAQICDGKKDCPDGFDENCVKKCVYETEFLCKDHRSCISKSLVCDGHSDCHDGSDEVNCPTVTVPVSQANVLKCRRNEKPCDDGKECVFFSHLCDGEEDCKDGSDEQGCPETCKKGEFQCSHGKMCIPEAQVCDGKWQCRDHSDELDCWEPTKSCEHRCTDGTRCIPKKFLCDGEEDCLDGSDEVGCNPVTTAPVSPTFSFPSSCIAPSVLCPSSSLCISQNQLCDGQRDCPDGFDENGCVVQCENLNEFLCSDQSKCIPGMQVCDGRAQCLDGSDEKQCQSATPTASTSISGFDTRSSASTCRNGFKQCKDGLECVMYSHVCDGEKDCSDGSDEEGCAADTVKPTTATESHQLTESPSPIDLPTKPSCTSPSVLCPGSSLCIEPTQICDGKNDCPDGFDEKCVQKCAYETEFLCKDRRRCVSKSLVCDGRSDCHDGSDEANCPTVTVPASQANVLKCRRNEKPCDDGKECVFFSHLCDGEEDCKDGSDEQGCPETCKKGEFQCSHGKMCIPEAQVCDGKWQCRDHSDELDCWEPTKSCEHRCTDGTRCIPKKFLCDGEEDCLDGSDEVGCNPVTTAPVSPTFSFPSSCIAPSVLCPSSSLCISQNQLCDGQRDCPDGFDENGCVVQCENLNEFLCSDQSKCIPGMQVCDGRAQCLDGSDEKQCQSVTPTASTSISGFGTRSSSSTCRNGFKQCKDGQECVMYSHVCDGEKDCSDGSDEEGCAADTSKLTTATESHQLTESPSHIDLPTKPSCTSPSVLCPGSSLCIEPTQICDGKNDCPDGFDEKCVQKCAYETEFLCKDHRRCISKSLVCDGRSDCHDGSDEANCPTMTIPVSQANVLKCRRNEKPCNDGKECIFFGHICDGTEDCKDGSDERGCQETCKRGDFQCSHGKMCIPEAQVCDGKWQCQDHSDELNCWDPTKTCEHLCGDGKRCISRKFLCDGKRDCLDGSDEVECNPITNAPESPVFTSASACIAPSVLCPGSSLCISQYRMCDGKKDCPDGFDENSCVAQCENLHDFLCSDHRKCIPAIQVCDGHAQCLDGSDEKHCESSSSAVSSSVDVPSTGSTPLTCRGGFKLCKDGLECVMYSHLCDGERDCKDGSDEEECAVQCKPGEFQCSHGKRCIPKELVCNGQNDCQDQSDEMACSAGVEGCDQRCDNNTRCIPKTFLCDGERDCTDGSDEEKCGLVTCAIHQYRCASGQCVSEALRCDGYADCSDRSDEADCSRPPRCPEQLRCPNSHECLQKEWLCDGEEDCQDGSDEKNCNTPPAKCREYQWQCGDSSQCIPVSWRCDGTRDCYNGMDEDKCSQRKCPSHLYQCGSGECVDTNLVCNGITNCADGSDESTVCTQDNCSSPSAPWCDHRCVSTPHGPRCFCAAGFRLQSKAMTCVDIDECNSGPQALCKQSCLNNLGSYSCHCYPGYYMEPDKKSCKTKDEPLLLASVQSELLLLGVHSGTLRLLSSASRPVFSLDYHWVQQRVYWLSTDYQSIRWADINNSNNKGTLIKGVKSDFIAVDWVGSNLYWVDGLVGQILAVKLSNSTVRSQDCTVVLGEDLEQPSSLFLLPHEGLMLWSEIGSTPQIERAGMDGSKRKVVVSHSLSWPVSLAYDLLDRRVYWADEKLHCIGSASLDGANIKILQLAETPGPFSVAVFNDRIFWSDTKRRTIRSADKNTGKDQKVLLKRPGQPFGLRTMHAFLQPAVTSPCDNLRCSHLCLLAPAVSGRAGVRGSPAVTAVCRCPKGLLLSKDNIKCSEPRESSFILLLSLNTVYQIYLRSMRQEGIALKKMPNSRVLILPDVTEATGLDVSNQELYVANSGSVDVLQMGSSKSRQGLSPAGQILNLKDDSILVLAVDWVTSNLYWCSHSRPNIHVTSRHDGYTTPLLQGSLTAITSIALHPSSGQLCYTAMVLTGRKSQMEVGCAWMDGRNKTVLWKKSSIPISVVFSDDGTRIYWADTGERVISSIGVDGSGYARYNTGPGLLISFTYIENILFWVTKGKDVTKLWFSDGLQPKQLWFETKTSVVEIRGYSNNSQAGSNSCSNNGGCMHLCLAFPGGRTCKCGRGYYSINVTSCAPMPSCPTGKESCFDRSKCINSSKFCDGQVDCPDQSDEQDCPDSNSSSVQAKASNGFSPQPSNKNSVISVNSAACDIQQCNGHGSCITEGQVTRCQCLSGYTGEFCQAEESRSHVGAILGVFCLFAALIAVGFIFTKSRKRWVIRSRSTDTENLMANMGLPCDPDSDSEQVDTPVDVNLPLTLKSAQIE